MNLHQRLTRIERSHGIPDRFAAMTDDDIMNAIEKVDAGIRIVTGMEPADYARHLDQLMKDGEPLPNEVTASVARQYTHAMKSGMGVVA